MGSRGLKDGMVEVKARTAKEAERVPLDGCVAVVAEQVAKALKS